MLSVVGLSNRQAVTALSYMPMMFRTEELTTSVSSCVRNSRRAAGQGIRDVVLGDVGWVRFFAKEPILPRGPEEAEAVRLVGR
jgi:hypothetical protein